MEVSKDGVAGSSLKPEPSSPNAMTSHSDEKNVSTMNKPDILRKKRYLLECDEGSDGSLSKCNLIPLTEIEEPGPYTEHEADQGLPISEDIPNGSTTQCTATKCQIPHSKYKNAMKKSSRMEGEKDI